MSAGAIKQDVTEKRNALNLVNSPFDRINMPQVLLITVMSRRLGVEEGTAQANKIFTEIILTDFRISENVIKSS